MPTIEIVSLNSAELKINQDDFDIAVIAENKLESHRSLFNKYLLKQKGTIIHIGNPDMKNDKELFFANKIINWDFESPDIDKNRNFIFQFLPEYKTDIKRLINIAIDNSPEHKIYFLTDIQLGAEKPDIKTINNINEFWNQHDNYGLTWNSLYKIKR